MTPSTVFSRLQRIRPSNGRVLRTWRPPSSVRGSYCDWRDIRCQVLNRYYVEGMPETVMNTITTNISQVTSKFEYSIRDYVANVTITTSEEVDLGLYNGEKRRRQAFVEDGIEETFYFTLTEKQYLAQSYVDYASLLALYKSWPSEYEHIFTKSFRGAIEHLKETDEDNFAAVDSFLNVYGTHVIVSATMGGRLNIDLMNSLWRYRDQVRTSEWTTEEFLAMVEEKQSHSGSEEYQWIDETLAPVTPVGMTGRFNHITQVGAAYMEYLVNYNKWSARAGWWTASCRSCSTGRAGKSRWRSLQRCG